MLRRLVLVLVVAAIALPASACGRKNQPIHPEGSDYPKEYPTE